MGKKMTDRAFERLANAHGLDMVWTTMGINGYPQNEDMAVIGFDDWWQAQSLALARGFEIKLLRRRDGWSHWEFRGTRDKELDILTYTPGDWEWYGKCPKTPLEEQEKEFIGQWWTLNDVIGNAETCSEITEHARLGEDIWGEIETLGGGEIVLYWPETGKYERTRRYSMRLHDNDVWEYAVALVRPAAV